MSLPALDGVRWLYSRRSAWPAYILVAAVVTLPIAALVGAFAFDAALEAQADVRFGRDIATSNDSGRPLRLSSTRVLDDGTSIQVVLLASGEIDLAWPGLGTVPEVGTAYLSDSLMERRDEVAAVVPEIAEVDVVDLVPQALLAEPGEAVVVTALPAASMPAEARPAGAWDVGRSGVEVRGRVFLPVLLGLLIPSIALFRACSGYLVTVNQEAFSVLRLFGVRTGFVLFISALLMLILCMPGALVVLLGLYLSRHSLASFSFGSESVFTSYLSVSASQLIQVAAIVGVVVLVSTLWSSRDVVLDPLSVRQRITPLGGSLSLTDAAVLAFAVVLALCYQTVVEDLGDLGGGIFFVLLASSQCWAVLRLSHVLLDLACVGGARGDMMVTMFAQSSRRGAAGLVGLLKALALAAFFSGFVLAVSASLRQEPEIVDIRVIPLGGERPSSSMIAEIDGVGNAMYVDGVLEISFAEGLVGRSAVESRVVDAFGGAAFVEHTAVLASEQDVANSRLRATMSAAVTATALLMLGSYVVYTIAMLDRKRPRFSMLRSFGVRRGKLVELGLLHLLVPLACFGVAPLAYGLMVGAVIRDPPVSDVPLVDPSAVAAGELVGLAVLMSIAVVGFVQIRVGPEVPRSFD